MDFAIEIVRLSPPDDSDALAIDKGPKAAEIVCRRSERGVPEIFFRQGVDLAPRTFTGGVDYPPVYGCVALKRNYPWPITACP